MKKKLLSILLSVAMVASLCACGASNEQLTMQLRQKRQQMQQVTKLQMRQRTQLQTKQLMRQQMQLTKQVLCRLSQKRISRLV